MKGMLFLAFTYTVTTLLFTLNWGIIGTAWAALVSECMFAAYLFFVVRPVTVGESTTILLKPVVTAALITVSLHMSDALSGGLKSVLAIVLYIIVLFVTKQVKRVDLEILLEAAGVRVRNGMARTSSETVQ
jgi:hypothetical protein